MHQLAVFIQLTNFADSHPAHIGDLVGGGVTQADKAVVLEHPVILDVLEILADSAAYQLPLRRVKVNADLLLGLADCAGQAVLACSDAAAYAFPHQRKGWPAC